MEDKDIFLRIDKMRPSFSKGQNKLADYILSNYDKAAYMTAARLGEVTGVSESTVVRFAMQLGYEGYPQLQKDLKNSSLNRMNSLQRIELASDSIRYEDVLTKVLHADILKIKETLALIDNETFLKAVDSICIAKKVYVIGVRSCAPLASTLAFYLNLMFEDVILLEHGSPSDLFEQMIHMDLRDVLVAFSFPRYSNRTKNACKYARECKAKVITITDSSSSPLQEFADYSLVAKSDMMSIADSLVAPMSVINALVVAISIKKQKEVSETFKKLESLWDKHDFYNHKGDTL
ncbi:MAG: MurR/RpiR family transcriptional regulator [Lachnospiraceae bacterium]|nr:MurR/RpiR family transcriptional regulator [Lachnospiraceae bacterium]